mgnify:CR=1 FL=1
MNDEAKPEDQVNSESPQPNNDETADLDVPVADVANAPASPADEGESMEEEIVADLVEQHEVVEVVAEPPKKRWEYYEAPPIPKQFQNMAADGGAVTALVLGVFALVGAFFSDLSAFNGILGLAFGGWGLTSNKRRTSIIGGLLCGLAIAVCVFVN